VSVFGDGVFTEFREHEAFVHLTKVLVRRDEDTDTQGDDPVRTHGGRRQISPDHTLTADFRPAEP
jgi:hypothetical protein